MKSLLSFCRLSVILYRAQKVLNSPILMVLFIFMTYFGESEAKVNHLNPVLPPVAVCKNISVQLGAGGTVTINGSDVDGGSYDPDGTITNRAVSPNTFNCSQIGSNSVVLTVTDNEGLTSTCSATVNVEDKTDPVIICKNVTIYLDASGNAALTVADLNNGSTDNCSAGLFLYLSRTSFNCSDVGSPVNITLIGTDVSGNSSSCISQVTVMDTISPVINYKPFTLVLGSSGTATLVPNDIDNGTYDNCGSVTLSVSPNTFSCSDLGQKTVILTALDSHGNSSSHNVTINITSTLDIASVSLSTCDMSPTIALFDADTDGGDGNYSYFWRGLNAATKPFMVIIPFPPSLQFANTSILESPFFNNTMANGYYDIRLVVTDGNGCSDSTEIKINKTGAIFNNQTMRHSQACEGEIKTYSANYRSDAVYSWAVTNGTIITSDPDTSKIDIRWNLGVVQGRIVTTISEPNILFSGGQCESTIIDTVTIMPIPTPVFSNPVTSVCTNSTNTYSLTGSYTYQNWTVTGGVITNGGKISDNFVTVRWGSGPAGSVSVSAGYNSTCTASVLLNVAVSNLSGSIISKTDITCNGSSDGSVTVAAATGTGQAPYAYSLDGGIFQTGGTFTGISIGNHSVRIRDASLCTFDLQFVINQPDPVSGSVSALTNIVCFGENSGSATIAGSGGVAPYLYRLDAGALQSSNIFNGLAPGNYIVTIQDSHGCTGTVQFTITQPAVPLDGSFSVTDVVCFGGLTGRIDLTVTGGVAPYAFLWNNGSTTEDIINIASGDYNVVITDANGCTAAVAGTITQPASTLAGTALVTNVLCFAGSTGAVNLTVTGGTTPYSFAWNNGASTEDILNVPAGLYSVVITDVNNCSASIEATVAEPSAAVGGSITSQTDVSCFGGNNGTVSVSGTGGAQPYEYQLGVGTFQSSGTFGSLSAGTYSITVRDANLCAFILMVTITEPAVTLEGSIDITNISCFGDISGACNLSVTGGTPPYSYLWSNGAVTEDINNVSAGNYSVTITDSHGCTVSVNAAVTQPAVALGGSITSSTEVSVYGGNDGSLTAFGSGGISPYVYRLDGGSYQASGTFSSLPAGTYTITIRDAALCTFDITATITQPWIPLTANIISQVDISCQGGSNGTVTIEGWGGTLPYLYSIDGGEFQISGTFGSLSAGTYTITVKDMALDLFDIPVTITEAEALIIMVSGEDVHCFGGNTGSVTASVTGGIAPYSYSWNSVPVQSAPTATGLTFGTYTVTVTDANGCIATNDVTISQPGADMVVLINQDNILCSGSTSGSASVTVTGGLEPYTFSWSTTPEQTKETATDLSAGGYTVTITDSYGCVKTGSVTITEPLPMSVESSVTPASCPDSDDGSISLSVTGGSSPFIVLWSDGSSGMNLSDVAPGTYTAVVTDKNNCGESVTVNVEFTVSFGCIVIPQVITPNNDGFNDEWRIRNIDLYPDAEIRIFTRWGKMIFSTKNLSGNPWDGTIDGKPAPTDSYHYILYLNDGSEPRSGVISVIR
jgi:large repetitive protein